MNEIVLNLPEGLENMNLPDPELVTYYRELEERIFWLEGEITPDDTMSMAKQILVWNREDKGVPLPHRKPIKIYFFCPGGDLDTSNALIDAIELSKTPVWGINMGQCASGAAYTFLACHRRFTVKRGYFLFHQGSGAFSGSFEEVCYQIAEYQAQVENLANYVVDHTKYTVEEVEENISTEWYIHADEAVEKGVCEAIVEDIDQIL